jgi:hypothetical protein
MKILLIPLIVAGIVFSAGWLWAQYQVPYGVFANGGGARSGSHIIYDTPGQPAIGISGGPENLITSGFWYFAGLSSTVDVAISMFTAELINDVVVLHWSASTGGEMNGFNIYRAEGGAEAFDRINADVLPARTRASYRDETVLPGRRYDYQIAAVCGEREIRSPALVVQLPPKPLTLYQNHPNPFNPSTTISFFLPDRTTIVLEIFDVGGRKVRTLVSGVKAPGRHVITWDGRNEAGVSVGSGIYCCRLQGGKKTLTKKMVVIR